MRIEVTAGMDDVLSAVGALHGGVLPRHVGVQVAAENRHAKLLARLEHRVDLGVVGDVAVEDEGRAELGGEFGDAILEALALVAEGELGAFAPERPGDAVGDRPVRKNAGDEEALAGKKSHGQGAFGGGRCERFWHAERRGLEALTAG